VIRRAVAAAAVLVVVAGCGGGGAPKVQLRVIVPDSQLRERDEPCAGAEPFGYVHAQAPFHVLDARGATVYSGTLPEGRAIPAFNQAAAGADRAPTFCQLIVPLDVDAAGAYRFVLSQGSPLPFRPRTGRATVMLR
jgi:hypothetical protein